MRVLVTGGVGFVGSNLIEKLHKQGYEVISVDNYSTGKKENEHSFCEYHNVDLQEHPLEYVKMRKPDIIYHLAAKARIVPSIQNPTKSLFNNIDSTINILEYARLNNVPVVYAGSSSSHGDIYANPYTFTKWNGEELCKLYHNVYDLPIAICRFYNVYGPYGTFDGGREKAPAALCRKVAESKKNNKDSIDVWGDGEQTRSFLYIDECIEGTLRLFESDYSYPINIGSDEQVSINQMIGIIEEISGVKALNKKYQLDKPKGVRGRSSNNDLIKKVLNWSYQMSLKDGLTETYKWIESELSKKGLNFNRFTKSY